MEDASSDNIFDMDALVRDLEKAAIQGDLLAVRVLSAFSLMSLGYQHGDELPRGADPKERAN